MVLFNISRKAAEADAAAAAAAADAAAAKIRALPDVLTHVLVSPSAFSVADESKGTDQLRSH